MVQGRGSCLRPFFASPHHHHNHRQHHCQQAISIIIFIAPTIITVIIIYPRSFEFHSKPCHVMPFFMCLYIMRIAPSSNRDKLCAFMRSYSHTRTHSIHPAPILKFIVHCCFSFLCLCKPTKVHLFAMQNRYSCDLAECVHIFGIFHVYLKLCFCICVTLSVNVIKPQTINHYDRILSGEEKCVRAPK